MADRMSPIRRRAILQRTDGALNQMDIEALAQVAAEDVPALAADVELLEKQLASVADELAEARAQVKRVREMHRRRVDRRGAGCIQCGIVWPCPTYTALDGTESGRG
ncbi:hypothetical protein [Actinomadura geliboluensis]|uniref:hypothetical protein n=1 Tax=Actinomadura geliboluensis TaxID=882440 RepID=UPI003688B25A